MSDWAPDHARDHLAAVGHGPALLARSVGISAGLRCAFIHPGGVELRLTVRARGVQSQAACRQTFPSHAWSDQERQRPPRSAPAVTVRVDDRDVAAEVVGCESSADEDTFSMEAEHWVGALPGDGRLVVTVGWPQAGLAEETTTLHLSGLDISDSVVQLLP